MEQPEHELALKGGPGTCKGRINQLKHRHKNALSQCCPRGSSRLPLTYMKDEWKKSSRNVFITIVINLYYVWDMGEE